ncbi:hypothetical protein BDW02DRAFT_509894 [Decorospora gaudefroyi]|uniref:Rhodopsin domain-containing protein n=1 Tax=Decorospora gaudefroyi TaxID=184978 RepID=A0A6A5JZ05_9PLEO|nr:hypothetical protein BDW02DRAFT_509894 [Decorospora gaudefroyi]
MLLNCRPIRYSYSIPIHNPQYCFPLKPFTVSLAALGITLDCLTWCLPHYVVWRLQLRLSHKIAVSFIFALGFLNIFITGFRIDWLARGLNFDDRRYGIRTTFMWALAQISTGIVVACCLHLRPLFEFLLACTQNHLCSCRSRSLPRGRPGQSRNECIRVTTKIFVDHESQPSPSSAGFPDGKVKPWAPTFQVEQGPAKRLQYLTSCCGGSSRGCPCPC